MAVFTIVSIPLIIPLFHFLFSTRPEQSAKPDSYFDIIDWLQYYFLKVIENYGADKALLLTCLFIALTIFLKNLFRYLALYIMVPVRSSVARDLRAKLYTTEETKNDTKMKYPKDNHSFSNPNEAVIKKLNLNIILNFDEKDISIPFPHREVFLHNVDDTKED